MMPSPGNPRVRIFVPPGAESREGAPPAAPGREVLTLRPPSYLRDVPGRQTFALDDLTIVKRYRGLDLAEALRDLATGRAPRSAARREYDNLVTLAVEGFAVPRARACYEAPGAPLGRGWSAVVMERVPHEESLRQSAERRGPSREQVAALLDLVVRLHERGWYHRDLYLEHVVIGPGGALVLLDLGRARRGRRVRRRWFVKDLAALAFSTRDSVGAFARLRFLAGYLDKRGVTGRRERREWARAVVRKERRIAGHVPRHG